MAGSARFRGRSRKRQHAAWHRHPVDAFAASGVGFRDPHGGASSFAPPGRSALSQAALAFATMYATLVSLVYFVQITLVAPRMMAGDMEEIEFLRFVPYRSFLFAVDLLGYSFMSVATLLAAFALPDMRHRPLAKAFLLANGLLLPFLAFQMFVPQLIWAGALWAITFPVAMLSVAAMFARSRPGKAAANP